MTLTTSILNETDIGYILSVFIAVELLSTVVYETTW